MVFSGFATAQFWVLVCVLVYGVAMQSTGLARRLSLYVLSVFPGTYRGVLAAFLMIGTVLALGVPSMTVRTAIMVPVAWALTEALALEPRSAGTALIVLTSIEMAVLPGCAFLTGSLYGPLVESLFHSRGLELSWSGYMHVMAFPTLLLSTLIVIVNPLVVRPTTSLGTASRFARQTLAELGRITGKELITAGVIIVSTAYWATGHVHDLPAALIGIPAVALLVAAGIVQRPDVAKVPWTVLLLLGGLLGFVRVLEEVGMAGWAAGHLAPIVRPISFNPLLVSLVAAGGMLVARFMDPTGFVALTMLFLPFSDLTRDVGLPPTVLLASLLLASAPFWISYQNIWVLIGEGVTGGQGFTAAQRIRLAHTYALLVLVSLTASIVFWRAVGVV